MSVGHTEIDDNRFSPHLPVHFAPLIFSLLWKLHCQALCPDSAPFSSGSLYRGHNPALLSSSTAKTKISLSFCLGKAALGTLCCQVSALLQAAPSAASSLSAARCAHVCHCHPGTAAMGLSPMEMPLAQIPGKGGAEPARDAVLIQTDTGVVEAVAHRLSTGK